MLKKTILTAAVATMALSFSASVRADDSNANLLGNIVGRVVSGSLNEPAVKVKHFSADERNIIRTVFDELLGPDSDGQYHSDKMRKKGHGRKSMPPGLAKRSSLPPGLQKRIDETEHLPPGLEGRELPYEVRRRLKPRNDGTEILWVQDDVYLVNKATRAVLDVIKNVVN